MSDFPELATQGWKLATPMDQRSGAFCDVVEAGDLPMLPPEGKKHG